jgi:hypothetical protein
MTEVTSAVVVGTVVDIRPLKSLSVQLLPASSLLRRVLSSEPDKMQPAYFLAKLGTWLALLREERLA